MNHINSMGEISFVNGLTLSYFNLGQRYRPWLLDEVLNHLAARLEESIHPESFETLCVWARNQPHHRENQEYVLIGLAVIAAAYANKKTPPEIIQEVAADPQLSYTMFFDIEAAKVALAA